MLTGGGLGFLPLFLASLAFFLACSLTLRITLYLCDSVCRLLFEPLLFLGIAELSSRPRTTKCLREVSPPAWWWGVNAMQVQPCETVYTHLTCHQLLQPENPR